MNELIQRENWKSEGHAEGMAEGMLLGMLEARRADIERVLHLRFRGSIPADITASLRACDHMNRLIVWLDAAVLSPDYEWFRRTIAIITPDETVGM